MKHLKALAIAIIIQFCFSTTANAVVVDILIAYDRDSRGNHSSAGYDVVLANYVDQVNGYYTASEVDIELHLVGTEEVASNFYSPLALTNYTRWNVINKGATTLDELRDQYGADVVVKLEDMQQRLIYSRRDSNLFEYNVILRDAYSSVRTFSAGTNAWNTYYYFNGEYAARRYVNFDTGQCDMYTAPDSYVATFVDGWCFQIDIESPNGTYGLAPAASPGTLYGGSAYAIVDPEGGSIAIAHELGHMMGLAHDRVTDPDGTPVFDHGRGYGVSGQFATIMAYSQNFGLDPLAQLGYFSNPDIDREGTSTPMGVDETQADSADASDVLQLLRFNYASFRPTVPRYTQACSDACDQYPEGSYNRGMCVQYSSACQ